MLPPPQQSIVYRLNLPQFVNNFKQQITGFVVPQLLEIKAYINSENNQATVNPLISILAIGLVLYIVRSILVGLFGKRAEQSQPKNSPQLNAEVNDLKKQLKGLKSSFAQLIKQFPKQQNAPQKNYQINQNSKPSATQNQATQLLAEVLPLYTLSLENNKKLVDYVLQSQFEMLKELKRFKKAQRASLSSGRPSTSTIRSKTSQKKLEGSTAKSPTKQINSISSIKKPQIKNSQRSIRSQIHEKIQRTTQQSFLIPKVPQPNLKTELNSNNFNQPIRQLAPKQKIPERTTFEKIQRVSVEEKSTFKKQQNSHQVYSNGQTSKNTGSKQSTFNHNTLNIQQVSSFVHQQAFPQTRQKVTVVSEVVQTSTKVETVIQQSTEPMMQAEGGLSNQGQLQEPQVFIPLKIPVIKKLNPPKPGGKRAPPPPPKK